MKLMYIFCTAFFWNSLFIVPIYANQKVNLYPGEKLKVLNSVSKDIVLHGWTRIGKGIVYLLPVKKGEHLKIIFSSRSHFSNLAMFDLLQDDNIEAIYSSDIDGNDYVLNSDTEKTLLLRVYYPKVNRRRGLGVPYTIHIQKTQ